MLIDNVTITIHAGNGGSGSVHFLRNAQTRKGGPDGGNGGNGGDLYVQGVNDILGLSIFQYKKELHAEDGVDGRGRKLFGKNGDDLILHIPIGTTITDTKSGETWDITNEDRILLAKGGHGGRGNDEFKTATNQTPTYAEPGLPGQTRVLHLELKLIADIGFIGLPNAGKSSLLATLTNAKPKIGNYPFTTLEPNLGVMEVPQKAIDHEGIPLDEVNNPDQEQVTLILADIPGIIEGAAKGKGLGTEFLRHVEKTKYLVHCIDATSNDLLKDYNTINEELAGYSTVLRDKPQIIFLTKKDLISDEELKEKLDIISRWRKSYIAVSIYETPMKLLSLKVFLVHLFSQHEE